VTDNIEPNETMPLVQIENLKKHFWVGKNKIRALRGVDLEIERGEFLLIYGPSGCGKTTLLNIIAGLDVPSSGKVFYRDLDLFSLDEDKRGLFRSKRMGMVHQISNWVKSLNTIENVALPLVIEGKKESDAIKHAGKIMEDLKIKDLAYQLPTQLSGGEQQKAELARALISNPPILLADEPTGDLDMTSSDEIMALFDYLNQKSKRTIIMVSHNPSYASLGTRRIDMQDGKIIRTTSNRKKE
jgi:putative ABC transport system ATP-binding protein